MGKGKSKRDHKTSSGRKKLVRTLRTIRRLKMKINRWDRYKNEIESGQRKGKVKRWDTSGLQKHIELLESFV